MFSTLVAVALLKAVMAPELFRLTIPEALLVIPAIVPEPFRLIVPVFVKPAMRVEIAPAPEIAVVPELLKPPDVEPMEHVPPIFKVPLFVKVPVAPSRAVPTVSVPVFVYVPLTVTEPIDVMVEPLNDFDVPENVWMPVFAVNVEPLLVKLPAKE